MSKKKMTPAQAAAARRPDDWESPQNTQASSKKKSKSQLQTIEKPTASEAYNNGPGVKFFVPVAIAAIALAIITPFIIIFVSNLFGISST